MLIKCASARRHQCLVRLQFYWRTEEFWCLCALSSRRLGPATVGGIKLGCIRLRNQWRCAQQHRYVKALSRRICRICFHVWRDVQRIEQHYQQEFLWSLRGCCHWWKKRPWKSFFFFGDHVFRFHDALGARILLFLARSVVRMEAGESGKVTKPAMLCWHMCILFCCGGSIVMRAPKFGGDLETAASKNQDMKESGIRARCS